MENTNVNMEIKPSTTMPIQKYKKKEVRIESIYSRCLITRNVVLPITSIGNNIHDTIEKTVAKSYEGKCIVEGFVKPNSTKVIRFSSGIIQGVNISFVVIIECEVCFPVEGMLINCVVKNVTKAGIRAESATETPSPIVVFIARDHHYSVQYFSTLQENDKFTARVIGQRFELNDKYVSIIAELVVPKDGVMREKTKPKIVFQDEA